MKTRSYLSGLWLVFVLPTAAPADWWGGFGFPSQGGKGLNGSANAFVEFGGALIVGGSFTQGGNNSNLKYVGRWNGSGWSGLSSGLNGDCWTLDAGEDGNLYVGGAFTHSGGQLTNHIARWNGATWSPLAQGVDGPVDAIATNGSRVFVGGLFSTASGVPAENLAEWSGSSWSEVGGGVRHSTSSLVYITSLEYWAGNLYVGGFFNEVGNSVFVENLAKWDGASWENLGAPLGSGWCGFPVECIYTGFESGLIVAGKLDSIAGTPVNAIGLWNGVTWVDLGGEFDPGAAVFGVTSIGSRLYAVGNLGVAFPGGAAMWNGVNWEPMGIGVEYSSPLSHFSRASTWGNSVYFGGPLIFAGGFDSRGIARWMETSVGVQSPQVGVAQLEARAFPNPSPGTFSFDLSIPNEGSVSANVYSVTGAFVANLYEGRLEAGRHMLSWDGRLSNGPVASPGTYFVRATSSTGESTTTKVTILD